jgi:hypothetical protein
MPTKAEILARARTRFVSERPDLDPEAPLAVLAPRIGADGRIRRVSGQVVSLEDAVDLLVRAADTQASPPAAPQATITPEVDLVAYRNALVAQRAAQAAEQPRSISAVLDRMDNGLGRITPGR